MERGCDRWVIKTFLPRMLDIKHWVKEDLMDEAMAKAEATKEVTGQGSQHPFLMQFMEYMEFEKEKRQ